VKAIRFVASDPQVDIEVPVGNFGARLVGGLGGYEEIERQDDVNITDWSGQDSLRQDISVLLDGWAAGDSVERELNTLLKLGRDPNGERRPPVFKVYGPVYYPGKAWVLPADGVDLSGGEIPPIRRRGDGELLRQEVIFHLLEFNKPDEIRLRGKKKAIEAVGRGIAVGGTVTVREGDTLHRLAAQLFGDSGEWKELGEKNDIADPNRKLTPGRVLRIP
jgi:hypothetical protein